MLEADVPLARPVLDRWGLGLVVAQDRLIVLAQIHVLNQLPIQRGLEVCALQLDVELVPFLRSVDLLARAIAR